MKRQGKEKEEEEEEAEDDDLELDVKLGERGVAKEQLRPGKVQLALETKDEV